MAQDLPTETLHELADGVFVWLLPGGETGVANAGVVVDDDGLTVIDTLRAQLTRMVLVEGVLIGAVGILGGTLLGALVGRFLLYYANVAQTGWYFPYRTPYQALFEVAVLVLVASALAGRIPAHRAASRSPAEALDYE